jgi:hypothetical protein
VAEKLTDVLKAYDLEVDPSNDKWSVLYHARICTENGDSVLEVDDDGNGNS